VRRRIRVWW